MTDTVRKFTLTIVPASDLIARFIPDADDQDVFGDFYLSGWTWGDTEHTLVKSNEFFETFLSFWVRHVGNVMPDLLQDEYWHLVTDSDLIDLEN